MSAQGQLGHALHRDGPANSGCPALASTDTHLELGGYLPALDGVRGLAVLMVLMFHFVGTMQGTNPIERAVVTVTSYGAYGVELFFVLSGFLITGILYDDRNQPGYFRNFYMRRVLRIFPLYYGVLALLFLVAPLIPMLHGPSLDYLVERQGWAWLYGVNVYIGLQGDWSLSYINHFWSLAVEEHFYFFWPLVVFLLAHRPRTLIAVSLAISLGAIAARVAGTLMGLSWLATYVLTPFRLDGLALGAFLAVAARQPGGFAWLVRLLPRVAIVAGLLVVASFAWNQLASRHHLEVVGSVRAGLIIVLLSCLLIWTLAAPKRSISSRFFCSRIMTFLGTYSYGLYVYHHFISYYLATNGTLPRLAAWTGSRWLALALQVALGMSATLALAYPSYRFIEKRFLALKRRFAGPA